MSYSSYMMDYINNCALRSSMMDAFQPWRFETKIQPVNISVIEERDRTLLGLIKYGKPCPSLRLVRRNENDNTTGRKTKKKKK